MNLYDFVFDYRGVLEVGTIEKFHPYGGKFRGHYDESLHITKPLKQFRGLVGFYK